MTARPAVNFPATLGEVMRGRAANDLARIVQELVSAREELARDNAEADRIERRRALQSSLEAERDEARADMAQLWAIQCADTAERQCSAFERAWERRIVQALVEFDIRSKPAPAPVAGQQNGCGLAIDDATYRRDMGLKDGGVQWTGD